MAKSNQQLAQEMSDALGYDRFAYKNRTKLAPRVQSMRPVRNTIRSSLTQLTNDAIDSSGAGGGYLTGLRNLADGLDVAVDAVPLIGDAVGVQDTMEAYNRGNMVDTGVNALATALGVVPVLGDVAGKGVKKVVSSLRDIGGDIPVVSKQTSLMKRPNDFAGVNEMQVKYSEPEFIESPETNATKSRETETIMSPADFLNLADDLFERDVRLGSEKFIRNQIEKGEPLQTPFLDFDLDDRGVATVISHEGRHRARVLEEMGIDEMPVRLRSQGKNEIRWSEQNNPNNFDRLNVPWPKILLPQNKSSGSMIRFPISDPLLKKS